MRVPDTHEAIIPHETFDKVQALLVRDTRTSPKGREVHLFSGFLKCADCGKSITRSQSGKNIYYACSTYKNRSRTACSMHSIKHNRLEAAVLFAIQYQVNTAVSYSELIARINSAPLKKSQSHRLNDQIADRSGVTLRIYHRLVEPMEQRKILQNATRKNKLMPGGNDVNETIEAQGNLQDVVELLTNLRKNKEPLLHCSVFIELKVRSLDKLKELQSEISMEVEEPCQILHR